MRMIRRHSVWVVAVMIVAAALVRVRLEVTELRERLDRSARGLEAAEVLNSRLAAELDARRGASSMQEAASTLGLVHPSHVVDLREDP